VLPPGGGVIGSPKHVSPPEAICRASAATLGLLGACGGAYIQHALRLGTRTQWVGPEPNGQ
jgi:hypothetical protein